MNDPSKILDGLLVLKYRSGTKKALNILVNKYHSKLCRHSYWYTSDIDVSKDIVQESWGTMVKKMESLKDPNLFSSWAFRIVTRGSLDYLNKRKRELEKLEDYYKENVVIEVEQDETNDAQKLLLAIQKLSKEQQMVLRLFYTESYSLNEISVILDVSLGTVKSRLFHAREKLKIILKK
jgi:RNA polymerase sigma-70 factor (ECF subfamily)